MDTYSWDIDEENPMRIDIKKDGEKLFSIFLGEAMEAAGRHAVMRHVKECENSPWIDRWHEGAAVEVLKGKHK